MAGEDDETPDKKNAQVASLHLREAGGSFDPAASADPVSKRKPSAKPKDHREGHRERLRARFMDGGRKAVADYELLELILFRPIARQDVKPIAKALLEAFGDFASVLSAPPAQLKRIKGVGDAVVAELKIIEAAAQAYTHDELKERDVISSWDQLVAYCRAQMAQSPIEQFRVLYLDKKNALIADEVQTTGTVDQVPVFPREVVRRALEHNASAVIVVHNHPSGDAKPSPADIEATNHLFRAANAINVKLHDHIIISKGDAVSFYKEGLLPK